MVLLRVRVRVRAGTAAGGSPWKPPPRGFDTRTLRLQASALRGETAAAQHDEEAVRGSSLRLAEARGGDRGFCGLQQSLEELREKLVSSEERRKTEERAKDDAQHALAAAVGANRATEEEVAPLERALEAGVRRDEVAADAPMSSTKGVSNSSQTPFFAVPDAAAAAVNTPTATAEAGFRVFTEACRRSKGMRQLAAARRTRAEAECRVVLGKACGMDRRGHLGSRRAGGAKEEGGRDGLPLPRPLKGYCCLSSKETYNIAAQVPGRAVAAHLPAGDGGVARYCRRGAARLRPGPETRGAGAAPLLPGVEGALSEVYTHAAVASGLAGPDEPAPLCLAANSRIRGGLTPSYLARTSVGRHEMSAGGATVYDVRAAASAHRRRVGLSRGLRALLRTSPPELRRTRQLFFVLRGSGGGRGAVVSVRAARAAFVTWSEAASRRRRARDGMDVNAGACRWSALVRAVQELRRFAVDAARQRRAGRAGLLRRSFAVF
eukprot:g15427.t1